ncbi:Protein of unknown function [Gryllus bimaculatus]|nr:Protein of unknown function [Gryllus bimaculatus]
MSDPSLEFGWSAGRWARRPAAPHLVSERERERKKDSRRGRAAGQRPSPGRLQPHAQRSHTIPQHSTPHYATPHPRPNVSALAPPPEGAALRGREEEEAAAMPGSSSTTGVGSRRHSHTPDASAVALGATRDRRHSTSSSSDASGSLPDAGPAARQVRPGGDRYRRAEKVELLGKAKFISRAASRQRLHAVSPQALRTAAVICDQGEIRGLPHRGSKKSERLASPVIAFVGVVRIAQH